MPNVSPTLLLFGLTILTLGIFIGLVIQFGAPED